MNMIVIWWFIIITSPLNTANIFVWIWPLVAICIYFSIVHIFLQVWGVYELLVQPHTTSFCVARHAKWTQYRSYTTHMMLDRDRSGSSACQVGFRVQTLSLYWSNYSPLGQNQEKRSRSLWRMAHFLRLAFSTVLGAPEVTRDRGTAGRNM